MKAKTLSDNGKQENVPNDPQVSQLSMQENNRAPENNKLDGTLQKLQETTEEISKFIWTKE